MNKKKIKRIKELKRIVSSLKKRGERIVFTNGCFDILHPGHIKCLEKASSYGDKLIVAINSDSSIRKIKTAKRPILTEKDRALIVASLEAVDFVIIFKETTPFGLIKTLKPDVLVKGGDWHKKDIVGKDFVQSYGGKVFSVTLIKKYSTSALIARIKQR